jgi:hypothetical protein
VAEPVGAEETLHGGKAAARLHGAVFLAAAITPVGSLARDGIEMGHDVKLVGRIAGGVNQELHFPFDQSALEGIGC